MHAVVHLKNNELWTTLKNQSGSHDEILNMCNFHLIYLGRGLFIELTKHKRLLEIIETTEDVKVIAIGGLTFDESESLDKVIFRGLGIGVDRSKGPPQNTKYHLRVTHLMPESMIKMEPLTEYSVSETTRDKLLKEQRVNEPIVEDEMVERSNWEKETEDRNRTASGAGQDTDLINKVLDKAQVNRQEKDVILPTVKPLKVTFERLNLGKDETVKLTLETIKGFLKTGDDNHYSTDDTIDYWTLGNKRKTPVCETVVQKLTEVVKLDHPKRRIIRSKPSKGGFKVSIRGVHKRKVCTYLTCKVPGCKRKFPSTKEWNSSSNDTQVNETKVHGL